jgi:hypothetical protein
MAKGTRTNPAAFVLQFIGSIIYLALVYLLSTGSVAFGQAITAVWLPLLYAGAVVSSIILFIVSFTYLLQNAGHKFGMAAGCATVSGGFALIALSMGSTAYLVAAIIGFIIAVIGTGLGKE